MAIPDFQLIMLPILELAGDKQEHTLSDTIDYISDLFQLTTEERKEQLPSGRQARINNRVGWATTYLRKAILIENVGRGRFVITQRGLDVLQSRPEIINLQFLNQFEEVRQFRTRSTNASSVVSEHEDIEEQNTPEEVLEYSYQQLRKNLAQEMIERVKLCSPRFFEKLVVDLLVAMGYGGSHKDAGQAVGQSGDGGIDGIIKEDRLGLDVVYIQAKRWENSVGSRDVRDFAGSLDGVRARKGVFITTSYFTRDAIDYVNRIEKKIVLIDGEQLAQLLIDYSIGTTEVSHYVVKRLDEDYFVDA